MTIGLRSLAGSSHFEIRLDPVDLGRIDVRLEIDKEKGTVTTKVVVERPETLALLRRDADNLQQALSQAGLDPGAGISLSLRDDGASGGAGSGDRPFDKAQPDDGDRRRASQTSALPPAIELTAQRMLRGIAGIDIRI
jgi:flagellar hook-length control protein FliK